MTEEEVQKYIAQLAFSGAKEFMEKMQEQGAETQKDIIGKFGLGFFSAFMVADKVEVDTLSMNEGAKAVKWSCDGGIEYEYSDSDRSEIGTTITLYINEDSKDFLESYKLRETLVNHCRFMPYNIYLEDLVDLRKKEQEKKDKKDDDKKEDVVEAATPINTTEPLWKKDPTTLKDEDYKKFYRELFPMDPEPLFWLHLNVDHPFTLEGILYFPKFNKNKPFNENNIQLYCRQVFVSDNVKNIIPEFLSLLKGTIDSTDIPLNVSRSALQGDPNIKKISNYIVKKVGEALKKLYKKDRARYEEIWEDIGIFVKYGCVSETKFDDIMRERVIFKNSEDKYVTLSEYQESIPADYKEKLKGKVIYFEQDRSDQALRKQLLAEGIHALITDDHIDPHFMQHIEMKTMGDNALKFVSIDSEVENLLSAENTTDEDIKIKEFFQKVLLGEVPKEDDKKEDANPMDAKMEIEVKKLKAANSPAYFKVDEQMKRFAQMTKSMGQDSTFPVKKTLVINPNNELIKNAYKISEAGKQDLAEKICHHVQDLATISSEGLETEAKDQFVTRTQDLIKELTSLAL
jgi:molecular chaperone HtpG